LEVAASKLAQDFEESLSLSVEGDADEEANVTVLEKGADQPVAVESPAKEREASAEALLAAGDATQQLLKAKLKERGADAAAVVSDSIPADDSFCQDQPVDTSSTRSVESGSRGSRGSISDAASLSPSPRKNPRRARLAAKFSTTS
jgi:hypothetical protein